MLGVRGSLKGIGVDVFDALNTGMKLSKYKQNCF